MQSRPPLCDTHHDEYEQKYREYKKSSRQAQSLYDRARLPVDWSLPMAALDQARTTLDNSEECILMLDTEIRQRQEFSRRFFTEPHREHEIWIDTLWARRLAMEYRVEQLSDKIALVESAASGAPGSPPPSSWSGSENGDPEDYGSMSGLAGGRRWRSISEVLSEFWPSGWQ